jgi:N utilization substance protein B
MTVRQLRLARVIALQSLYQLDCGRSHEDVSTYAQRGKADATAREMGVQLAGETWAERERLDGILSANLENWTVPRLGVVERSVLRLAVYEFLNRPEVPEAVVIDEAVRMAKRFASERSGALVNAVLDKAKAVRNGPSAAG